MKSSQKVRLPVSSVKLGTSCKSRQFGGSRRFLQTQFSATGPKILPPKPESIPKSVALN